MLRFHTPLIEPDGRISRIRLSEKVSRFRPRKATRPRSQANEAERVMQGDYGIALRRRPLQVMLGT